MKNAVSQWVCRLLAALLVTGFLTSVAFADGDKEAKKESRRMQAQLSAAQKEKAALAAQVDDLKKQIGDLGSKSAALEKKSGGQRKQFTELTEKYQETDKNLQLMTQQYSDTSKALQQLQKEKEQEQKRLSGDIQVCEKKNAQLYQISVELMDKYQSKGVFTSLLQAEPFTQLEKVKMQNLLQEYHDKAEAAKIASTRAPVAQQVNDVPASASSATPVSSLGVNPPADSAKVEPAGSSVNATTSGAPVDAPVIAPASVAPADAVGSDVAANSSGGTPVTSGNNGQDAAPRP